MDSSPEDLLRQIERHYRLDGDSEDDAADGGFRPGFHPLPMRVELFWERENFNPAPEATIFLAHKLHFDIRVDALDHALAVLTARHEALRTRLVLRDKIPTQRLLAAASNKTMFQDHSMSTASADAAHGCDQAIADLIARPFLLSDEPLFRPGLFKRAAGEHILVLTMHHYISDAVSLYGLWEELCEIYSAIVQNKTPQLDPVETHYIDYARWQRRECKNKLSASYGYWEAQTRGHVARPLALQRNADDALSQEARFQISSDLFSATKATANSLNVSAFAVLLAAFQSALAAQSGSTDIITAIPVGARARPQFRKTIGYLINAVPIRSRIDTAAPPAALVKHIANAVMTSLFLQDVSYELIEDGLCAEKPLCTTMFNFVPSFATTNVNLPGAVEPYSSPEITALSARERRFRIMDDFVFYVQERDPGAAVAVLYNSGRFRTDDISAFFDLFVRELEAISG